MTLRNTRRLLSATADDTITAVDTDAYAVTVAFATGERAVLAVDYLGAGHLTHAYAITVHKAQGLTCDRAFTLGSDTLCPKQGYVAMSRGRLGNHLYVGRASASRRRQRRARTDQDRKPPISSLPASRRARRRPSPSITSLTRRCSTWTIGVLFARSDDSA